MDKNISTYIRSRLREEGNTFNFSRRVPATLLSTDFALNTLFLLEGRKGTDEFLPGREYLHACRTDQDYFMDPGFHMEETSGSHSLDYIRNQFTYFTLIALDMSGILVRDPAFFYEHYSDAEKLSAWIEGMDFSKFWYNSNKLMFVLYYLSYIIKHSKKADTAGMEQLLDRYFAILNEKQDKNTGYWGTDLNQGNLYDGCYGSAHLYLFYDYYKREIPHVEKIIDNTLKLHASNGLLGNKYGGACEDYDAIDIYLRCLNQTDHRKGDVINMLEKMRKVIGESQHRSGGFPYRISQDPLRRMIKIAMKRSYMYSGWRKMETIAYEPDLWATWFRTLSLKVIDYMIDGNEEFNSYHLPAWGYIR